MRGSNLLPCDGVAIFDPLFLPQPLAATLLTRLQAEIPWQAETFTIYGKTQPVPRQLCWFGDHPYRYSGSWHQPAPWLPVLQDLRVKVEAASGTRFNSVLANLYRDGRDSMGWHADNERGLGQSDEENTIASVSLGAARSFRMRHSERIVPALGLALTSGSLLLMDGAMQIHWQHAIPKTAKPVGPRINLTFRWISG